MYNHYNQSSLSFQFPFVPSSEPLLLLCLATVLAGTPGLSDDAVPYDAVRNVKGTTNNARGDSVSELGNNIVASPRADRRRCDTPDVAAPRSCRERDNEKGTKCVSARECDRPVVGPSVPVSSTRQQPSFNSGRSRPCAVSTVYNASFSFKSAQA